MNSLPLKNITVLNTRPAHQAEPLSKLITDLGGKVLTFPTMEIIPVDCNLTSYENFDIAIFVSANAVRFGLKKKLNIPVIVVGPGTAKSLKEHDISSPIIPEQYNSEGILALPILEKIESKRIIIFCGENPRPLLKEALSKRNANVTLATCYRRVRPDVSEEQKQQLLENTINLIISTSKENLTNLYTIIGSRLLKIPLLVISPDMKTLAEEQGWQTILLAPNATDQAIVDKLKES